MIDRLLRQFAALVVMSMSACAGIPILDSRESQYVGGRGGGKVELFVFQDKQPLTALKEPLKTYIDSNRQLKELLVRECELVPPSTYEKLIAAPILAVILPSLGKFLYDQYLEANLQKIEELKEASQRSYSDRVFLPLSQVRTERCGILMRYNESANTKNKAKEDAKSEMHFIGVIKILPKNANDPSLNYFDQSKKKSATTLKTQPFTIQPIYVKVNESLALTKNSGKEEPPMVNVTVGASLKVQGTRPNGVPGYFSIGEEVVSVGDVKIGTNADPTICDDDKCPESDLLPAPTSDPEALGILTISIVETGRLPFQTEQASAELRAIKEAFGPVVEDLIREPLNRE